MKSSLLPIDTEVREKSRWIDVEKTVKMLAGTSCPAQTAFKMANISIDPAIANKIDYKLKPSTIKETSATQRKPVQTYKPPSRQPSRDSSAMISQHLLAECSVAFRDYCKAIPLENNPEGKQRTSLYVQIQELVHIFREVEDKWGAPVVNEKKLKSWVKRNG